MATLTILARPAGEKPTLLTLPAEVLCVIITHLTPTSLIDLSQTSKAFRNIIKPTRGDFLRRLLAWELLPEFGGIVPLFRARDNALTPPWDSPEWRRNKYACSVCLKLRSHMWFDNHSILRLGMRKPPPGSREAEKLTDWEPLELRDPAARWKRVQQRVAEERELLRPEREIFHRYCNGADNMNSNLLRVDFGPIDRRAAQAEKMLCGTERHKRACNECRRLRGDWNRPNQNYGSLEAPIIKSRQVQFPRGLDRNFPGLVDYLKELNPGAKLSLPDPLPRLFKVWQEDRRYNLWTLHTAWCGSCHQWQELAGLRQYVCYPVEKPVRLRAGEGPDINDDDNDHGNDNSSRVTWPSWCNECARTVAPYVFNEQHSPYDFNEQVSNVVIKMAERSLVGLAYQMTFGWTLLHRDFTSGRLKSFADVGLPIVSMLPWDPKCFEGSSGELRSLVFNESTFALIRDQLREIRRFLMEELPADLREELVSTWFKFWLEDYELHEDMYLRMHEIVRLIKEDRGVMESYFRDRDPYRI